MTKRKYKTDDIYISWTDKYIQIDIDDRCAEFSWEEFVDLIEETYPIWKNFKHKCENCKFYVTKIGDKHKSCEFDNKEDKINFCEDFDKEIKNKYS